MKNMKRWLSMLLIVVMIFSMVGPYIQVDAEEATKTVIDVNVSTTDKILEGSQVTGKYWDGITEQEVPYLYYDISGLNYQFEIIYNDETSEILSRDELYNKFGDFGSIETDQTNDSWEVGWNNASFWFLEQFYDFQVEVIENPILSITGEATSSINVDNYDSWCDGTDDNGEDVYYKYYDPEKSAPLFMVTYTDGSSEELTKAQLEEKYEYKYIAGYSTTQGIGNEWSIGGNNEVTFTFLGHACTFNVELVEGPIRNLTVMTADTVMEIDAQQSWYWDEAQGADVSYTYYNLDNLNYSILVDYTNGDSKTFNRYELESEFDELAYIDADWTGDPWEVGMMNTARFHFMGKTYNFNVKLIQRPIKSISVSVTGNFKEGKTTSKGYFDENMNWVSYEHYDINTLNPKITVEYTDGSPSETLSVNALQNKYNYRYSAEFVTGQTKDNAWGPGTHTVTFNFMGLSCQFDVVVEADPIKSLSVRTEDTFIEGALDHQGVYYVNDLELKIEVEYTTGEKKTFTGPEFENEFLEAYKLTTNQSTEPWKVGMNEVTFNFRGKSCTFEVEVVETPIKSLNVTTTEKLTYQDQSQKQEWNDEKGEYEKYTYYNLGVLKLTVEVEYKDGTKEILKDYELVEKFNAIGNMSSNQSAANVWGEGMHKATWTFLNVSDEFDVEVVGNQVEKIEFGEKKTLYKDVNATTSNIKLTVPELIVYYKDGRVYKSNYSGSGFVFGEFPKLNLEWEMEGTLDIGTYTVGVDFLGHTASYQFDVDELCDIEIYAAEPLVENFSGTQHEDWFEYDIFKASPIVRVYNEDGTYEDYKDEFELGSKFGYSDNIEINQSAEEPLDVGEHTQTISYFGKDATIHFKIIEKSYEIKDIQAIYHGVNYYGYNDYARPDQLEYIITYEDDTIENLFADEKLMGSYIFDLHNITQVDHPDRGSWDVGTHYYDIELLGFEMRVPVEVVENPVEDISARATKDIVVDWYKTGDEIVITDIDPRHALPEITVTYLDGSKETYSHYGLSEAFGGEKQIWVLEPISIGSYPGTGMAQLEFNNRFCWLYFNVVENPVESISAQTTTPLRQGSNYNLSKDAGLTITVNYKDGTTFTGTYEELYSEFFLYPEIIMPEGCQIGENTAVINYLGVTCEVTFDIAEDENPIIDIEVKANDLYYDSRKQGSKYCYDHLIEITLHYKDGTIRKGTMEEWKKEFGSSWIYNKDDQDLNPWTIGQHSIEVFCGNFKKTVDIQMVENPYVKATISGIEELTIILEKADGTEEVHIAQDFEFYNKINDNCTSGYLTTDQGKMYVEVKNVGGDRPDYSNIIYMSISGVRSNALRDCEWFEQEMLTKLYGDLPKVYVETSSDELKAMTLSDSDYMDSERAANTQIWLEITNIEDQITEDEEQILKEFMENNLTSYDDENGLLLDVTLYKQYEDGEAVKVTETNGEDKYVCITIQVPDEILQILDNPTSDSFKIIHIHEGETIVLDCDFDLENQTVTFYTNKFSTFSLVYEADITGESSGTEESGESEPESSTSGAADSELDETTETETTIEDSKESDESKKNETEDSISNPKDTHESIDNSGSAVSGASKDEGVSTRDNMNIGLWLFVASVSACLLIMSLAMMIAGRKKH